VSKETYCRGKRDLSRPKSPITELQRPPVVGMPARRLHTGGLCNSIIGLFGLDRSLLPCLGMPARRLHTGGLCNSVIGLLGLDRSPLPCLGMPASPSRTLAHALSQAWLRSASDAERPESSLAPRSTSSTPEEEEEAMRRGLHAVEKGFPDADFPARPAWKTPTSSLANAIYSVPSSLPRSLESLALDEQPEQQRGRGGERER
jgi:hypothetical protein